MKKSAFFICAGLMVLLLIFVSAYSQEDMVVVNSDAFDNPQRPPSVFRHEEHNEKAGIEECNECHHVYDDDGKPVEDESSEDQRCSECHELEASGKKPALMKAFHTNCKGCHKEKSKGPVMCGQCHVRGMLAEE
ncbi:MAG: cytochrome c3 family protein [Desulfobacterales bacterium]|nr:MAG: cytochrome c3 family protein [Desulfobacterales bacterium]